MLLIFKQDGPRHSSFLLPRHFLHLSFFRTGDIYALSIVTLDDLWNYRNITGVLPYLIVWALLGWGWILVPLRQMVFLLQRTSEEWVRTNIIYLVLKRQIILRNPLADNLQRVLKLAIVVSVSFKHVQMFSCRELDASRPLSGVVNLLNLILHIMILAFVLLFLLHFLVLIPHVPL